MGIYIHTITHISGRMSDKMSEIECQNMCQIELQIEFHNMCQIECQNICQVECQNICQDVCHGGDHTKLSNVFSIDSSSKCTNAKPQPMKLHANPFQRAATVVNPYIPSIRNLCLRGPLSTPPVVSGRITKIGI